MEGYRGVIVGGWEALYGGTIDQQLIRDRLAPAAQ